jgi:MYXO-CTERM domain-containing protein
MHVHSQMLWIGIVLATCLSVSRVGAQEFIRNGTFDEDAETWTAWPGYAGHEGVNPFEITEWFHAGGVGINPVRRTDMNPANALGWTGEGGRGINPVAGEPANGPNPFNDNGDNESVIAFLQGTSSMIQSVTGLVPGQDYVFGMDYNSRNCCGDFPIAELRLNDILIPELGDDAVFPVGPGNPWYQVEVPFTADSSELTIAISTFPELGADSTLLIDNVFLRSSIGGTNLVVNGDFEADEDQFPVWPGYVGGDPAQSPFRDNGNNATPVAFLQGASSLEQDISGLTIGQEYILSLDFNARNCCGDIPIAELLLDGQLIEDFPGDDLLNGIEPVGGQNDWYHFETTVVAEASSLMLRINTFAAAGGDSTLLIDNVSFRTKSAGVPGDIDGNGMLDAADINALNAAILAGNSDSRYDLNSDGNVDGLDRTLWVEDLKNTYFGDANLDGEFNSADFVAVFQAGQYEDTVTRNSTWATGDWNGDQEFNSSDFVQAFQGGGFEIGPRAAVQAVPEPNSAVLALFAALGAGLIRRRR